VFSVQPADEPAAESEPQTIREDAAVAVSVVAQPVQEHTTVVVPSGALVDNGTDAGATGVAIESTARASDAISNASGTPSVVASDARANRAEIPPQRAADAVLDAANPTADAVNADERLEIRDTQVAASSTSEAREAARAAAVEPKSAVRSGASNAKPSQIDPLARLIEGGRELQRIAQPQVQAAEGTQPIAARLAEVEGQIARDRVQQAVVRGELAIGDSVAGSAGDAARGSSAAAGSASNVAATAVPAQVMQQGAASATAGTFGAMNADSAPAPDLALPTDLDTHPSAQLAAKGVAILSNQRGGAITMRLEPPALGQLRIELHIQQGAVVADFTAATPEARVLLEANLGMLRERLESQGLSVERISVHGGRGTESSAPVAAPAGSDARQDGASARSDGGERGDRSNARQDAAGGESRGRRDGDARAQRDRMDAARSGEPRGFAAALDGERALRTEPMRRAG
jgi:flagellar hook-length control protein FliK